MGSIGFILKEFLTEFLPLRKKLLQPTIKSYRDVLRLFILYVAKQIDCPVTELGTKHFTSEAALAFLKSLEVDRGNSIRTWNHRLAVLRSFYRFLVLQNPARAEEFATVTSIPTKRCQQTQVVFLDREEIKTILHAVEKNDNFALRDKALILFIYNTGARVQEIQGLQVQHINLEAPTVRLHRRENKWRECPLWQETATLLQKIIAQANSQPCDTVFLSQSNKPLTRFGIYKIVRRHSDAIAKLRTNGTRKKVSPNVLRHSTAAYLIEAGVGFNLLTAFLGQVSRQTNTRYAELHRNQSQSSQADFLDPSKELSLQHTDDNIADADENLLSWLNSL